MLELIPINLKDAKSFVRRHHHTHEKPPPGHKFSIAAAVNGQIVAVCMVGLPASRMLAKGGRTLEVRRMCTDLTSDAYNACSKLYAAAWRAARALGYTRLVTYILNTENGASLRAANWILIGEAGGGSWDRPSRPRVDAAPIQGKLRFEAAPLH